MVLMIKVLFAVLFALYPFIIYFGLNRFEFWQMAVVIAILATTRIVWIKYNSNNTQKNDRFDFNSASIVSACLLLFFALMTAFTDRVMWLKLYPIVVSLTLFIVFSVSLKTDKCVIQRFAELREKDINADKQMYMIKLTKVWCGFFILNMTLSLATMLYASMDVWTLYNGLISYILMGTLAIGELAYRHWVVLPKVS